jgi:hypothetical protein
MKEFSCLLSFVVLSARLLLVLACWALSHLKIIPTIIMITTIINMPAIVAQTPLHQHW